MFSHIPLKLADQVKESIPVNQFEGFACGKFSGFAGIIAACNKNGRIGAVPSAVIRLRMTE
jgi:hypothetical protein